MELEGRVKNEYNQNVLLTCMEFPKIIKLSFKNVQLCTCQASLSLEARIKWFSPSLSKSLLSVLFCHPILGFLHCISYFHVAVMTIPERHNLAHDSRGSEYPVVKESGGSVPLMVTEEAVHNIVDQEA